MVDVSKKSLAGRTLVLVCAVLVVLMCVALLARYGVGEAGLRSAVRNTARTSALLFTCAFVARALCSLWETRASRWLAENQPYLFASFTASHVVHAIVIFTLASVTHGASLAGRGFTLVGGGLAYVFMFAICATSFGSASAWVESRRFARALRAFGLYLIWSIFMISFAGRAVRSVMYVPVAVALVAALALRVAASLSRRALPRAARSVARV
jgi:methionine sulfoxide reductase heme-binding subunit